MTAALKYHSTTTLRAIRDAWPCQDGWRKLTKSLGGIDSYGLDTPLTLLQALDSNGMDDALWVLSRAMPESNRLARHFQAWCAEQVLHIFERECPGDHRVRDQIAMLRRDDATDDERAAAQAAARAAAEDAALAAACGAAFHAARAAHEAKLREMLMEVAA